MKSFFLIVSAVALMLVAASCLTVARAANISLSLPTTGGTSNPCTTPTTAGCNPGNYINLFYQFAITIGGLVAFAAIVYGGVRYITSAGNPSSQHEAKDWIYSALLGLALLFFAYLILNTINPNLTHLDLPSLSSAQNSNTGVTSGQ